MYIFSIKHKSRDYFAASARPTNLDHFFRNLLIRVFFCDERSLVNFCFQKCVSTNLSGVMIKISWQKCLKDKLLIYSALIRFIRTLMVHTLKVCVL